MAQDSSVLCELGTGWRWRCVRDTEISIIDKSGGEMSPLHNA